MQRRAQSELELSEELELLEASLEEEDEDDDEDELLSLDAAVSAPVALPEPPFVEL